MASVIPLLSNSSQWARSHFLPDPSQQAWIYFFTTLVVAILAHVTWTSYIKTSPPLINPRKLFDFTGGANKAEFVRQSYNMIYEQGRSSPYSVNADTGRYTVLPPSYVDELKNHPRFTFQKTIDNFFHSNLPGFQPFAANNGFDVLISVAKNQLTKFLNKVTKPLSTETSFALQTIIGDSPEWKELNLRSTNLQLVARISSRVFLGEKICRNKNWLKLTTEYTTNAFLAAYKLNLYPKLLLPIVHWFLPECALVRAQYAEATSIIQPVIDQRNLEKRTAAAAGKPIPKFEDAIEWAEESKGVKYSPAMFQLALSAAAIHTTTDVITSTIINLLAQPELMYELRNEVIQSLGTHGWTKLGLYNLKLMDSVLKETLRLKPIQLVTMKRTALSPVQLADGIFVPKGGMVGIANLARLDPGLYENPEVFNGHRFLEFREMPGKEHLSQLVTTGAESLGFGHGMHACPGRFFAANEIKVALSHLLLKYDMELCPGTDTKPTCNGFNFNASGVAMVRFRRRKEEVDIDNM